MKRKIKKAEAASIYVQAHCSEKCIFLEYCFWIHVCDIYLHACMLVCVNTGTHMVYHKHVYVSTGMHIACHKLGGQRTI